MEREVGALSAPNGQKGGGGRWLSKNEARSGLRRLQAYIGAMLILSSITGMFLLVTDKSLWLLAVSHALGLIVIIVVDAGLGLLSLRSVKRAYTPSLAGALLGVLLQLGDVVTAPQYGMSIPYFASYLFRLWAFDVLITLQVLVLVVGMLGRAYAQHLARTRTRRGKDLSYSRRGFLRTMVGLATIVAVAVGLGSVKLPPPSSQTAGQTTPAAASGVQGAIANVNSLQPDAPVYFQYPQGYPNMLLKKTDGSLIALSLLCTHVCCQCSYDGANSVVFCPCHGSVFDLNGGVLRGPAVTSLPTIELSVDGAGNVTPVGVKGSSPCLGA